MQDSEDEPSDNFTTRRRTSKAARLVSKSLAKNRNRSGTASSTQTHTDEGNVSATTYPRTLLIVPSEAGSATPTRGSFSDVSRDDQSTPEPYNMPDMSSDSSVNQDQSPSTLSVPAPVTPATAGTTDDSDTDFQSAYSTSPRASYVEDEDDSVFIHENDLQDGFDTGSTPSSKTRRERASSTATAINTREHTKASLTFSVDTLTSQIHGQ